MNHKSHMTHYKGRPLKDYSQAELIQIVIDRVNAYEELLEEYRIQKMRTGKFTYEVTRA